MAKTWAMPCIHKHGVVPQCDDSSGDCPDQKGAGAIAAAARRPSLQCRSPHSIKTCGLGSAADGGCNVLMPAFTTWQYLVISGDGSTPSSLASTVHFQFSLP